MSDDDQQEEHSPGECPGCDAARVLEDMDAVFAKHAQQTGREQGELMHLMICRYVDGMASEPEGQGLRQVEGLVAELALIIMAHRGERVDAEQEAGASTKH